MMFSYRFNKEAKRQPGRARRMKETMGVKRGETEADLLGMERILRTGECSVCLTVWATFPGIPTHIKEP